MKSYTAHILYRIVCDGTMTGQYEEQWRIIFAPGETAALEAARRIGKTEECSFSDRHGRIIKWELLAVKEIQEISVAHGALLLSAVREAEPVPAPLWIHA